MCSERVDGDCLLCWLCGFVLVIGWKVGELGGRVRNIGVCSFS
jgi:hypothetical protein